MSHKPWRITGALVIAILALMFVISYSKTIKPSIGTYWNLDAGFGDSELKFLDGGRYTNGGIGAVSVEGNYTLTQDQIVFTEYGPADAPCLHIPGTYKWNLDGQGLSLKEVEDKCPTRQYDWGSGYWFKHK